MDLSSSIVSIKVRILVALMLLATIVEVVKAPIRIY